MTSTFRKVFTAVVATALTATAASAQLVNFSTTGVFTSPAATCNGTNVCAGGGFTLTFNGASTAAPGLVTPTFSTLGTFTLTGTGSASVNPGVVNFALTINQTSPTMGSGVASGTIFGSVTTVGGNSSTLVFTPNRFVNIDPVQYEILFTAGNGVAINNNGPGTVTSIDARITSNVIPEPSTYALMGTGLLGLLGVARRNKKA